MVFSDSFKFNIYLTVAVNGISSDHLCLTHTFYNRIYQNISYWFEYLSSFFKNTPAYGWLIFVFLLRRSIKSLSVTWKQSMWITIIQLATQDRYCNNENQRLHTDCNSYLSVGSTWSIYVICIYPSHWLRNMTGVTCKVRSAYPSGVSMNIPFSQRSSLYSFCLSFTCLLYSWAV